MIHKVQKLLILAGAGAHCKVVESARSMGVYTIVTDYLRNSPAKKIADESLMYNIFDVDELTKYAKEQGIIGVLNFCIDPAQRPAQQIAERCGLPCFGSKEQVRALTNKKAFKRLCVDNGVDVILEYKEDDIESNDIKYPVLVKPVDSRGSRGATICRNKKELLHALPIAKAESSDASAIIEEYMIGHQDLTITYLVKNSDPVLISIGDRYSGKEDDNLNRQLVCTIQPSRYALMYMENVNDRVVRMIKNLGIKNGPVFMQGFVDGDTVRMYDPGIRFPGNEYERIYKEATGIDLMKSIIQYVLGGEIDDYKGQIKGSYNLKGRCAIQYMINAGPGKISTFDGLDDVSMHPNVVDVQQKRFIGEIVEETGDIKHRIGEISILVDRDPEQMKDIIRFIQSKLVVLDEGNKNMLISPFELHVIDQNYNF